MCKKKIGLKGQFFLAALLAVVIALGSFFLLNYGISLALDQYFVQSTYIDRANERCLDRFAEYVTSNNISATDTDTIAQWVDKKKSAYLLLVVSREDELLYDSLYYGWEELSLAAGEEDEEAQKSAAEEPEAYGNTYAANSWLYQREIDFADGTAEVTLYGFFEKQFYTFAVVGEIILAVVIFSLCFMGFVRRKVRYIIQLEQEIKVLETGGLDHEITVKGREELAYLADGLNQMRLVLGGKHAKAGGGSKGQL